MPYQDEIDPTTGDVTASGYRDCEARYEVVRRAVEDLRRPFTVLDLGASEGYFSLRLTRDFGARAVAVESRPTIQAAEPYLAAVVNREVDAEAVRRLGTYDVVLGLSFLHHVPAWVEMLGQMDRTFRSVLVVETPNPEERLRRAIHREDLAEIVDNVERIGARRAGEARAVWESDKARGLYVKTRAGLPTKGVVAGGGGNNSGHVRRFADELSEVLGYRPFPGSLNVFTRTAFRLGPHAAEYVDGRRGRGGRKGGDYQIWPARVDGYDGPAHVIRPGVRGHGRRCLEVWAPDRLRTALDLIDGDEIRLRIGA